MSNAWRIMDTGLCSAAFNMALDEAIATDVRLDRSPPTLRFYAWNQPAVSIGYFQRSGDVNIRYCRENDIHIVRRPTGGRAVFHRDGITYSFSAQTRTGLFSHGLFDSYKRISSAFQSALSNVGFSPQSSMNKAARKTRIQNANRHSPLCFQSVSYGEISIHEYKVIGAAQKRWTDGLLQQGFIPFMVDENEIGKLFNLDNVFTSKKPSTGLQQIAPSLSQGELKNAIQGAFQEAFQTNLINLSPTQEEIALAHELEKRKYLYDEWTFKR